MNKAARTLLDAHVAHELARLQGESLGEIIDAIIADLFEWFGKLEVEQLVTRQHVVDIIDRYVIELQVSAGIRELAGEMARVVLASRANTGAAVRDVVSEDSFEDFASMVLSLRSVQGELIGMVARSEAFGELATKVVSHALADGVRRSTTKIGIGPAAALTQRLQHSLVPELEQRVHSVLQEQLDKNRERFANEVEHQLSETLDHDSLRALIDELWEGLSQLSMDKAFGFLGDQDLEEFVVLVLEFWLRFRETDYFKQVVAEAVGHFYDKYGRDSAQRLIEDMGVSRDMVAGELRQLLIPLVVHANDSGFLERQVRRHLEDFYASPACAGALEPAVKKATAKKPPARKPPAKKPATKKPAAKKPAAR